MGISGEVVFVDNSMDCIIESMSSTPDIVVSDICSSDVINFALFKITKVDFIFYADILPLFVDIKSNIHYLSKSSNLDQLVFLIRGLLNR